MELKVSLPICQRSDHKPGCIAKILIGILELCITDIGKAILLLFIPSVSQLTQPLEGLRVIDLLVDQGGHNVTGVHVDGANGHDLLTVTFAEFTDQHVDESIELMDLLIYYIEKKKTGFTNHFNP